MKKKQTKIRRRQVTSLKILIHCKITKCRTWYWYVNAPVLLLPSELISALLRCGEIKFAKFAEKAVNLHFVWWGNLFRILCISLHARHEEGEDDKSDTRRVSMPAAQVVYTHRLGGCSYWLAFVGLRKIAQIVSLWNQWIQQAIWWRICTHNKSCFQCFDFVVVVVVFFGWEEEPRVWVSWLKNLRDVTGCSRIRHLPDGVILLLWPD